MVPSLDFNFGGGLGVGDSVVFWCREGSGSGVGVGVALGLGVFRLDLPPMVPRRSVRFAGEGAGLVAGFSGEGSGEADFWSSGRGDCAWGSFDDALPPPILPNLFFGSWTGSGDNEVS